MCQCNFNYKRTISFLIIFFVALLIGFGFSNSWRFFTSPNNVVIGTQSKVEIIADIQKAEPQVKSFKQMYSCEEIKNRWGYESLNKNYVEGGVLNGKSCFVEPIYPEEAIKKSVSGTIQVEVLVNGLGVVRSAKAISGPELLRKSAVEAAYKTKISPTMLRGEAVNVKGLLIYEFVLPE